MPRYLPILGLILSSAALAGCMSSGGGGGGVVRAQGPFTNATLQGAYGFNFSGFQNGGAFVVAVGRLVLDGNGNITSGSERRTEEGSNEFQFSLTGSYAVNPDGTGKLTMLFAGNSVDTWSFVLTGNGQKVKLVSIEPNNFLFGAVGGEMERQ